jgi:uncharacterized RDD family membrane protein YckC
MNPGSFCGSCGAVVKQGALYCGSCGAPAAAPSVSTPVPPPTMIGTIGGGPDGYAPGVSAPGYAGPPADGGGQPGFPGSGDPAQLGFVGYASFGRRVGAYLLDAVLSVLSLMVGYPALFAGVATGSRTALALTVVFIVIVPLAYFILLWAMAARGSSPGNAMLGIRVVRRTTGGKPGAGLGLGRMLIKSLLIGVTCYVGGFSPLWDSSGRRQGWWDSACGTVVLDRDAVPAYRAAVVGAQPPSLAAVSRSGPPLPVAPPAADEAAWGRGPAIVDDRPAWDVPPAPARSVATPTPSVSAASWGDRPADSRQAPSAASLPTFVPHPGPEPDPLSDVPWSEPATGTPVIQSVPGFGPSSPNSAPNSPAERMDHTRMRVAPQTDATTAWRAELDDGRSLPLDGPVILGRDPSGRPGDRSAVVVPVADEGRSVSKTHLLLDVGAGGVQVTDRHSTNGVVIVTAGVDLRCVPGVATPVPDGSTVRYGDRSLTVRRS